MEKLRRVCDYTEFEFESTEEVAPLEGLLGQERAYRALNFGLSIPNPGYNIYISGPAGTGKTSFARELLSAQAKEQPVPPDWCYLYNFRNPDQPRAISLPPGKGREFRHDVEQLIEALRRELPKVFNGEEYERLKNNILDELYQKTAELYEELEQYAAAEGFALNKTSSGLVSIPVIDGKTVSQEEFENLDQETKDAIQARSRKLQEKMNEGMRQYREHERQTKMRIAELDRKVGLLSVAPYVQELKEKYRDNPKIVSYLDEVQEDIVENVENFLDRDDHNNPLIMLRRLNRQTAFIKYRVNLLVDNSETAGAPVVFETNPTFANLFGSIEYEGEFGVLATDFTKIKKGALHAANGGYLVLQATDVFKNYWVWDALKRTLKNREIVIENLMKNMNLGGPVSLQPEPIPLDVKVILIGEPLLYQLLYHYDPDFPKLFKIKADFDLETERSRENVFKYAAFISSVCHRENLPHFDRTAVAKIIEYSSRLVDDQEKLSVHFNKISELIYEAAAWATRAGSRLVTAAHVDKAVAEKNLRSNLIEQRIQELILDGTIMIDTTGWVVGQVNGLAVYDLGDHRFGRPSRITAKTFMGGKGVINIERETRLSGQIHDKGVLTLSGYLGGQYALDKPLTLSASLGFEQLYGGIEGDSASSAELFALLSSLADLPIYQGIAVTGSVNQRGEIQPVGGINQKIEGFFRICLARGLTGDQGVIIPYQNVRNLMLDEDVIGAVKAKQFHIYPIRHVDEGIEILTGVKAGQRGKDGSFPKGTVHYRVDQRLREWAEKSLRRARRKRED